MRAWTDASGKQRLISAVVLIDNIFWYTFAYVSDKVWNQLQVRRDNQIGVQEMLAVVLLLETFDEAIRDSMMLLWIDNKGVLGSLRKGASKCMEMSLMVARCWMKCAERMSTCTFGTWRRNRMWRMALPVMIFQIW